MNLLKKIVRRWDALFEGAYRLIRESRRGARVDHNEDLGPCVHCGDDVIRTNGIRIDGSALHTACEADMHRDLGVPLRGYEIYTEAMRDLRKLGDEQVTLMALGATQQVRPPASRQHLAERLKEIADRISSDARVIAPTKDAVKAITANARNALNTGSLFN